MRTATIKGQSFTLQHSYTGPLVLVNPSHPLRQNMPLAETLTPVFEEYPEVAILHSAAKMMRVLTDLSGCSGKIAAVSGYRPHQEQVDIFEQSLQENGEEFTRKYVALPGCSEHQTGLALDVAARGDDIDFIRPELPFNGEYANFRASAADYGFILRYPQNKQHITGIGYEPWHFRYVGWPHSCIMRQNGWVLEEYIQALQSHTSLQNALTFSASGRHISVFTVDVSGGKPAVPYLPEGALWQASGNNAGGMVITVWN